MSARTQNRVLAVVQAGGAGGRMDVLTRERAKPALPFAGVYQLVDFPLSNLTHSGIGDVWLSVQFQGATLEEQVANGRPWDLDRNRGGLRLLMPHEGTGNMDEEGFARGNADELFRIRDQVADAHPELVLVLSADHVYRLDYRELLETHRSTGAECTLVVTELPEVDRPEDHAMVEHDDDGRVTSFAYKSDASAGGLVATEVICYEPDVLTEVLESLHRDLSEHSGEGDTGLGDFGDHLLPALVERGKVFVHRLEGYWRDLGQPHLYLRAHLDVLSDDVGVLGERDWPILTRQPQRVPARVLEGGIVVDSLVSPGARVHGEVRRSVLGPGVVVEAGAVVDHSVVFSDTVVRRDATVSWSVVDTGCEIGAGARVGEQRSEPVDAAEQVTLVGRESQVGQGVAVPAGSRLEPGSSA